MRTFSFLGKIIFYLISIEIKSEKGERLVIKKNLIDIGIVIHKNGGTFIVNIEILVDSLLVLS